MNESKKIFTAEQEAAIRAGLVAPAGPPAQLAPRRK